MEKQPENPADLDDSKIDAQIFTYNADWPIYALGFSTRKDHLFRMALGSFLEDTENKIEIIKLNPKEQAFQKCATFTHKYPPTKLMWLPSMESAHPDLLATSGESLKLWVCNEDGKKVDLRSDLVNQSEFSAPLTSFDWSSSDLNLIGTSSIDTTCTIWDVEKSTAYTQLIAHDKEVYDISFAPDSKIFGSVGADGSARQFDLRNLEQSTVLFETENSLPLLRISWNKIDQNYIAVVGMDQSFVTLLDMRHPLTPVSKLVSHQQPVNAMTWAPQTGNYICTVADDCQALIWNVADKKFELNEPQLEFKAEAEITNLAWSTLQSDWLAICFKNTLQFLRV